MSVRSGRVCFLCVVPKKEGVRREGKGARGEENIEYRIAGDRIAGFVGDRRGSGDSVGDLLRGSGPLVLGSLSKRLSRTKGPFQRIGRQSLVVTGV